MREGYTSERGLPGMWRRWRARILLIPGPLAVDSDFHKELIGLPHHAQLVA